MRGRLVPEMKRQIELTFDSVKSQFRATKASFEIFGFDFIVDSEY